MKARNYIKIPAKVAEAWGVEKEYPKLPDGNYVVYWSVPRAHGYGWADYPQMLKDTGGVILTPTQVRLEQEGMSVTVLNAPGLAKYRTEETEDSETLTEDSGLEQKPDSEADSEAGSGEDSGVLGEDSGDDELRADALSTSGQEGGAA